MIPEPGGVLLMDIKIAVIEDDKKLNEGICLSLKEPGRTFFRAARLRRQDSV